MEMKDKMQGKAREMGGKMSDNKKTEMKGKMQQGMGNMKEKASDMKEDMRGKMPKM